MPVRRTPSPEVLSTWRSAKAVCFDVDSTLCTDESIDEIAAFLGVGEQVAALTSQCVLFFFLKFFFRSRVSFFPRHTFPPPWFDRIETRALSHSFIDFTKLKKKKKKQSDGGIDKV